MHYCVLPNLMYTNMTCRLYPFRCADPSTSGNDRLSVHFKYRSVDPCVLFSFLFPPQIKVHASFSDGVFWPGHSSHLVPFLGRICLFSFSLFLVDFIFFVLWLCHAPVYSSDRKYMHVLVAGAIVLLHQGRLWFGTLGFSFWCFGFVEYFCILVSENSLTVGTPFPLREYPGIFRGVAHIPHT